MKVEPYLFFEGRCEEALEFYRTALGAEVIMKMRYSENPEPQQTPNPCAPMPPDAIMHATFRVGETNVMASDGMVSGQPDFRGITLSISAATDADAQRLFAALSDGGKVTMPLTKTFFASSFGMLEDRFGVSWMLVVAA
jgi:PhnB protein